MTQGGFKLRAQADLYALPIVCGIRAKEGKCVAESACLLDPGQNICARTTRDASRGKEEEEV